MLALTVALAAVTQAGAVEDRQDAALKRALDGTWDNKDGTCHVNTVTFRPNGELLLKNEQSGEVHRGTYTVEGGLLTLILQGPPQTKTPFTAEVRDGQLNLKTSSGQTLHLPRC